MRRCSWLVPLALVLAPGVAGAANGLRPRTPAIFEGVPCMQTVERGEILHIEYSVPYDDTELTFDELPNSRKHQFFAFGEQRFDFSPPVWINQADFDLAESNGDITKVFGPDDILEGSTRWPAGTWLRITTDDPRLPITAEQAAMGVDWDTADVSPGTWLVAAYTWEPENNLWSYRFGAVRVIDPAEPDRAGPSLLLERADGLLATRGEPLAIPGCVEAPAGSTLTASWGTLEGVDEPQWVPFVEDEPIESGALALEWDAPAEAGSSVKLRVEITDPAGRSYVAYSPAVIGVVGDPPPADSGGGGGCAVAARGTPWFGLLGLLGLWARRRASCPSRA